MYITNREKALEYLNFLKEKRICMGLFCTASHWNTEAILYAAHRFAAIHHIKEIPLAVGMTYNYKHMPQAQRVTYCRDPKIGFLSIMHHLKFLCEKKDSPYYNVIVLPHLDHADPQTDIWPLTKGVSYLASVMFDAQNYPFAENIRMTADYVKRFGKELLIEGVMEQLAVRGGSDKTGCGDYVHTAVRYVKETEVDFLVADLGTEQQSTSTGKCAYAKERAQNLTEAIGDNILVMHGTSCLNKEQMLNLADDGIVRVNMWTRIVREAGQYAAERILCRCRNVFAGENFEDIESKRYLDDSLEKSAEIIEETLDTLGYSKLAPAN